MKLRVPILVFMIAAPTVLISGGGYFIWQERHGGNASHQYAVAAVVEPRIMALGEILPSTDIVVVAAPTGQDVGRIAEIRVTEGEFVEKGDVLATLDTRRTLEVQRDQAAADLKQRQAVLARTRSDIESNERTLTAQLQEQKAHRDRAKTEMDNFDRLSKSGSATEAEMLDKRLAFRAADSQVAITSISLERNRETDANGVRLDEASALADVASAKAALAKAESDLAKAFIYAPISGRLLGINGKVGEQVGSDGFAEIGDTTSMLIRAEVFETDLQRLAIGMACEATSRALAQKLVGSIERIGVRINKQSLVSTDPAAIVDARVVEVWIRLDAESSTRVADLSKLQVRVTFGVFDPENESA